MATPYFKFKQFTVYHDRCAMKVGTDGVLLGAWAPVDNVEKTLDVGTGTGLIALQLAQRNREMKITAIDIDSDAAMQAQENISRSPWADRVEVICCDFRNYAPSERFNLIVSNPPYFVDALKCPDKQRNAARHTDTLSYDVLFFHAADLLCEHGIVSLIIPSEIEKTVREIAQNYHFYPVKCLRVVTKPGKPCRRVLLNFSLQQPDSCQEGTLCIEHEHHNYTPEYIALTKDFYLNM